MPVMMIDAMIFAAFSPCATPRSLLSATTAVTLKNGRTYAARPFE
jgi:hypothetical protein